MVKNSVRYLVLIGLLAGCNPTVRAIDYKHAQLLTSEHFQKYARYRDTEDSRRIQFWCRDQFQPDGGGGASCGYHALRNGILLAKAALISPQCNRHFKELYSPAHMNAFFGTEKSPWRSFILQQRPSAYVEEDGSDWLEAEEILHLFEREKSPESLSDILRNNKDLFIATYGDTAGNVKITPEKLQSWNAGPGERTDEDSFLLAEFKALRHEIRNTQEDIIGVVVVYVSHSGTESSQSEDMASLNEANTNGHWFTLVVCRLNGQTQYLLTDSAGNQDRLRDEKVNEIIRHFEGNNAQERAQDKMTAISAAADSSSMQFKPHTYQVASVNPSLSYGQAKSATVVGMSLTAKVASTAVVGLAIYGGYKLYKRHTASSERENTMIQTSEQTIAHEHFLI